MKIAYLPIDERPCNIDYIQMIARSSPEIELLIPDKSMLGEKKKAANTNRIWNWLFAAGESADAFIISIDMMIYGGLLPSRLHYLTKDAGATCIERLRILHKTYPDTPIYASNLIMRTPKYSSSDEEPDYYEEWGRELFLNAYLQDKKAREKLSQSEEQELKAISAQLPKQYIEDYETRRIFNSMINVSMLNLLHEGVLTFLSIPQDDSSEFGYTAMDQKKVVEKREQLRLHKKVHMYPGADEVGATLLTRVYNDIKGITPKIYPIWSSTLGPSLIPLYEDRPYGESLKAHILAAGCQLVASADEADIILAYNTPGRVMQEAWEQAEKDITYTSFRNMLVFVGDIKKHIDSGKKVMVADSAYANGGDQELIILLDEEQVLDKLISYKGWNTNCNTLGTTICQGIIGLKGKVSTIQENLIYHLLDDYFYQAEVRKKLVDDFLPKYKLNYFDLKNREETINRIRDDMLYKSYHDTIIHSFGDMNLGKVSTYAPWNRMFECGMKLEFKGYTKLIL
ncbi:hypothetical protein COC52_07430 [Priestia megaterium]|uniref:DUF4127 family protein n=3 Tax=Priestia megaterium TaxID=1404 RepID=UPI000BF91A2A|nr:DUF4127 family protein [Priestia megaterium]PET69643.1 hypothetical protein CN533_22720 [Priestia megaterium]PFI69669.1 hypothetical protein COI68_00285 [Priestia megaterium]PGK52744.1 hypothetical protein CN918_24840 [Priestia megaterium]PGN00207.1 hypothetical protein CN955_27570 [Priestia megaterium]PGR28962.1 hypothetical protein COC52_07430 [Priestia megaterium]